MILNSTIASCDTSKDTLVFESIKNEGRNIRRIYRNADNQYFLYSEDTDVKIDLVHISEEDADEYIATNDGCVIS